jgi:hypothetical protein
MLSDTSMQLPVPPVITVRNDAPIELKAVLAVRNVEPLKIKATTTSTLAKTTSETSVSAETVEEVDPILLPALEAGVMYTMCRGDRSGSVIADMMYAHAFAFAHNITYGGSCCLRWYLPSNVTRDLLTDLGWTKLFPFQCPDGIDKAKYRTVRIENRENITAISPLLLHKDTFRLDGDKSNFKPAWRESVHEKLRLDRIGSTNTGSTGSEHPFEIAVHIRRGDVDPCRRQRRYLPNSHYLALIDQFTPNSTVLMGRPLHVTIYSESDSFEPFDDFVARNYTLALDTDNLAQIWHALATADVVILSRSTFSIIPAMVNPNTVVATEFMGFDSQDANDGFFDVSVIDGWIQADPLLVNATDERILEMYRTQCSVARK